MVGPPHLQVWNPCIWPNMDSESMLETPAEVFWNVTRVHVWEFSESQHGHAWPVAPRDLIKDFIICNFLYPSQFLEPMYNLVLDLGRPGRSRFKSLSNKSSWIEENKGKYVHFKTFCWCFPAVLRSHAEGLHVWMVSISNMVISPGIKEGELCQVPSHSVLTTI